MRTPLRVTFRQMEPSAAIEARAREHVEHLERFHPEIIACHVIVEAPAQRHPHAPFDVRVEIAAEERDVYVRCERSDSETYADVYIALRDAFEAAKRMLRNQTTRPQRETSEAPRPQLGTIEQLGEGSGCIAANDGHRVNFHRSSVHDASFEDLSVGAIVEFQEQYGDGGIQAAAVRPWRGSAHATLR